MTSLTGKTVLMVVVSPLVSLVADHVQSLWSMGIRVDKENVTTEAKSTCSLVFCAPEAIHKLKRISSLVLRYQEL